MSQYYPPRERWYGRIFHLSFAVRRALGLERVRLPGGLSTRQWILSLTIPGYSFHVLRQRTLGWSVQVGYVILALVVLVALGYSAANVSFGLLISIHVTSIVYLEMQLLRTFCRFAFRFLLAATTLLVVWRLVYAPMLRLVENHWVMPLRIADRVVVISRCANPESVVRGDWLACRLPGSSERGFYARDGFVLGPILAVGGDRIEFEADAFKVNGAPQQRRRFMPVTGELVVPQNHWFLWPEYTISGGGANPPDITDLLMQMATVSQEQLVGKPFKKWFLRRQILQPSQ